MGVFLAKRLGFNVAVLAVVMVAVSLLLRVVPEDPVDIMTFMPGVSQATKTQMRKNLGLTGSVFVQVRTYFEGVAHGNLGDSLYTRQPVRQIVFERLPATVELAVASFLIAIAIGIPLGVLAALKRDRFTGYAGSAFALVGFAVPAFVLGIVLIWIFSVRLGWLPSFGRSGSVSQAIADGNASELAAALRSLCLPAVTLGVSLAAPSTRMMRSAMLEALRQDYVRFARAKGLPRRVVTKHAVRNALIPVVTILGLQLGYLLGGTIIVENVFAWPGLGRLIVQSIDRLDYTVVQGVVLVVTVMFLTINLLVDGLYMILDPRIRLR